MVGGDQIEPVALGGAHHERVAQALLADRRRQDRLALVQLAPVQRVIAAAEGIADLLPGVVPGHVETTAPGVTLLDHGDRRSDILSRHQRRSAALDDADKVLYDQSSGIADCADA